MKNDPMKWDRKVYRQVRFSDDGSIKGTAKEAQTRMRSQRYARKREADRQALAAYLKAREAALPCGRWVLFWVLCSGGLAPHASAANETLSNRFRSACCHRLNVQILVVDEVQVNVAGHAGIAPVAVRKTDHNQWCQLGPKGRTAKCLFTCS